MCCCSTPPSCFLSREDLGEFYHRIFSRMKLNANIEQIEGKLYFNIRGEILVEAEINLSLIIYLLDVGVKPRGLTFSPYCHQSFVSKYS